MTITDLYIEKWRKQTDIHAHMPFLAGIGCERTVVELGMRSGRSTVSFLAGGAAHVTSVDIHPCTAWVEKFSQLCPGRFKFILGDSREVDIPACDILFIDSFHSGPVLSAELERHSAMAGTYIIMHDTETFGQKGMEGQPGMRPALNKFLLENPQWKELLHHPHCNGLTVLRRA